MGKRYIQEDRGSYILIKEVKSAKRFKFVYILRLPSVILLFIITALFIGIYFKDVSRTLAPFGEMYLSLLQMCIIPIVASALAYSIGKLASRDGASNQLKRSVFIILIALIIVAFIGTLSSMIIGGFLLSFDDVLSVSKESFDLITSLKKDEAIKSNAIGMVAFITNIIPHNIFKAVNDGILIQVVFFAIFMGFSVGSLRGDDSKECLMHCETVFNSFQVIINWTLYLLPFGVLCLIASRISSVANETLFSMLSFIVAMYAIGIVVIFINFIITMYLTKKSFSKTLREVKEPFTIALSTCNSYASIPYIISNLPYLGANSDNIKMTTPISITLGRFGTVLYFSVVIIFCAKMSGVSLTFIHIPIIMAMSIIGSIATAGVGGIAIVTMINSIISPIGIDSSSLVFLFIAIDPLIDPIRTLLIVSTNINVILLSSDNRK